MKDGKHTTEYLIMKWTAIAGAVLTTVGTVLKSVGGSTADNTLIIAGTVALTTASALYTLSRTIVKATQKPEEIVNGSE